MRITNGMAFDTLIRDIYNINKSLLRTYEKVSSNKKVNRPSDDPVAITGILKYKDIISGLSQYKRNIEFAEEYLTNSETSISEVPNILSRLKELAVSQASGTANASTRQVAAKEVDELYNQLIAIGNTRVGDRYLFAGYHYTTQPFNSSGTYSGDSNESSLKIGPEITFTYGLTGNKIFKGVGISGGVDIYTIVSDFKTALENDDTSGIQTAIDELENGINQANNIISEIGARLNRLESHKDLIDSFSMESEILLSGLEDADIAEVTSELTKQQITLQTLYAATSKVLGLNIFNFIR